MGYENGHGIYESYPADNCFTDAPRDEPCGYQPVVVPYQPQPIITESHHRIEHDWECCYVYHRVLWLLCLVLVLYSIAVLFFTLATPLWLLSTGGLPEEFVASVTGVTLPPNATENANSSASRQRRSYLDLASKAGIDIGSISDLDISSISDIDIALDGDIASNIADIASKIVAVGWLRQCNYEGCFVHSGAKESELPWKIGMESFADMGYLVPMLFTIHFILLLIFILHLLFPYPTIDALVFAFINAALSMYVMKVAMVMTNPDSKLVMFLFSFYLFMGELVASAIILLFIVVMCCTGCHF